MGIQGRRIRERGAATVEYVGALFVAAALVVAIIAAVPAGGGKPIAQAIYTALCRALGVSCGADATAQRAKDLGIKCLVNQRDRKLGYNGSFKFFQVDREDSDTLIQYGDGSGAVRVSQGTQASLTADTPPPYKGKHRDPNAPQPPTISADIKGGLRGDIIYQYNFPKEWGGYDQAQQWTAANQDTLNRGVQLVGGPSMTSVREGFNRFTNWAGNGINDLVHGPPSPQEQADRDRAASLAQADVVSMKTSLQGEGNVKGESGIARGAGQLSGGVEGQTDVAITLNDPNNPQKTLDYGTSAFTGTAKYDWKGEATLGVPSAKIPPIFNFGKGGGSTTSYKVTFDQNGEPTQLILTTETRDQEFSGIDGKTSKTNDAGQKTGGKIKVNENEGTASVETWTFDLADPTTRAAFDQAFWTAGVDIDGHTGKVAAPVVSPDPLETIKAWIPLMAEQKTKAFYTRSDYATSGDSIKGSGDHEFKVAKIGVGGTKQDDNRRLVQAVMRDPQNGNVEMPLVTCS